MGRGEWKSTTAHGPEMRQWKHRGQRGLAALSSFPAFSPTASATIIQKSSKTIRLEPLRQTY